MATVALAVFGLRVVIFLIWLATLPLVFLWGAIAGFMRGVRSASASDAIE